MEMQRNLFMQYRRRVWRELEEEGYNIGSELGATSYEDILEGMSGGEWFVTFIKD